jgi:hypothetical protein
MVLKGEHRKLMLANRAIDAYRNRCKLRQVPVLEKPFLPSALATMIEARIGRQVHSTQSGLRDPQAG